ncbi:NUDIX hydrolase [Candidatus Saccharibacteria bacterium oral taxon 488]|jgi:hydrolase, NUDIX family|nr:NUDIX hydrolase [Candidatus Saccharibacteria bacterium oral taxon 488]QJU09551.1 NUDIX hydrolase [Candidatus Saccharibacteria bacterium oral taxon 488]QJU11293.1 NUDIX hydrolase [Candidatus Saccharibacteria bacterium oral taxon 488]QLF52184.1 NUDIX hydrolase [Candidatus Saccharibacteria bacterium oral taxon 488]
MAGQRVTLRDEWGNLAVTLSCKAIVRDGNSIWLRKNERNDWELPGGRLDEGEQPEQTIVREIAEELGVELVSPRLVDVYIWKKDFGTTTHIGIVTFAGDVGRKVGGPELNGEAGKAEFQKFIIRAALQLDNLPEVYKRAIRKILI